MSPPRQQLNLNEPGHKPVPLISQGKEWCSHQAPRLNRHFVWRTLRNRVAGDNPDRDDGADYGNVCETDDHTDDDTEDMLMLTSIWA